LVTQKHAEDYRTITHFDQQQAALTNVGLAAVEYSLKVHQL
jgi:hypothetical protein